MSTNRMIPARELKRRGISSVDDLLADGPVHVIRNDQPRYVILTEDQYLELLDGYEEATRSRIKDSLEDIRQGRVKGGTAETVIRDLGLEP